MVHFFAIYSFQRVFLFQLSSLSLVILFMIFFVITFYRLDTSCSCRTNIRSFKLKTAAAIFGPFTFMQPAHLDPGYNFTSSKFHLFFFVFFSFFQSFVVCSSLRLRSFQMLTSVSLVKFGFRSNFCATFSFVVMLHHQRHNLAVSYFRP